MPRGLRLQRRDFAILCELGEVGLLDTFTIHERHFPSDTTLRSCRRRLQLYIEHRLVQPVFVQVASSRRLGRLPTLYRLTPVGGKVVTDELGPRTLRIAHSDVPKPNTLLHRLGMAKVHLALNDACARLELPRPEWLLEYDLRPGPSPRNAPSERFVLRHEFRAGEPTLTCWPDAACLLTVPKESQRWQLAILWEYDRATESHGQLARKLPGYERFLSTNAIRSHWPGAQAVRVFFVLPSKDRLRHVTATIKNHPTASAIRLAVASDLTADRILTDSVFQTTIGERRAVLPHAPTRRAGTDGH